MTSQPKLIPELDVSDLDVSQDFYVKVLGFDVLYSRPEERFLMLEREGVQIMLQQAAGPGRRFTTAKLEQPYGRGINFQIETIDVDRLYKSTLKSQSQVILPLEEKWYRLMDKEAGNRQFVVADPDGYMLRFFQDLGERQLQ